MDASVSDDQPVTTKREYNSGDDDDNSKRSADCAGIQMMPIRNRWCPRIAGGVYLSRRTVP
jgi:hypothetical protein